MVKGIIIKNVSNLYEVEMQKNKIYQCNARGKLKNEDTSPVAGDFVDIEILDEEKKIGIINQVQKRKNYTKRPKMANLSQIILVMSMKLPKPDLILLDKQLAYAKYLKIPPIICLNKVDLEQKEKIGEIAKIYEKIGYQVIKTDAKNKMGTEEIQKKLKGKITAFSGNSGVGKSTLINAIFQKDISQEGNISTKNQRGKNTTTQVQLYKVDDNSYIADTPGFSTFEISEIEAKDLAKYFIEFNEHIKNCEFIGCSHQKEENCGIKKAIEKGEISKGRYERYCKIYQELKEKEARKYK